MDQAILELRSIHKSFSGVHALRGVNFHLTKG
jgi:ABC-type sugar transport system ATPase subunit